MVWTLFIVFSFCFSINSIIFGDHTRPQHQETTKIVNLESLVLGVVKKHNCWFAFCVMVWVIIQCLFNHLHYIIWWLAHLLQQVTTLKFLPHALCCCNQNILNNIKTNKKKAIWHSTEKFYKVLVLFYGLACEQALLFGRLKRVSRECASERQSREGQRKGELATIPYKFSFVLRPDEGKYYWLKNDVPEIIVDS